LKIPKGPPESVNDRSTDNTMAKINRPQGEAKFSTFCSSSEGKIIE
jgi:hypothetical protein